MLFNLIKQAKVTVLSKQSQCIILGGASEADKSDSANSESYITEDLTVV